MRVLLILVLGCASWGALSGAAQDFSGLSEAERKQVNGWMAERAETLIRAHKLEGEIREAWGNTRYTSAETEALRARYRELQQELVRTQLELQKKVQEVPEVKEKARQLDEAKKKAQELGQQIAEKTGGKK